MVKVAFYYHSAPNVESRPVFDRLMSIAVKQVRLHMPQVEIWHMNGPTVPPSPEVDKHIMMEYRHRAYHHAKIPGEVIFLDIDVFVQGDLTHVFDDHRFGIAATVRNKHDWQNPPNWKHVPYNAGVSFGRSSSVWMDIGKYYEDENWPWNDTPYNRYLDANRDYVKKLPGRIYNYTPGDPNEDVSDCLAVHYKGRRERWMLDRG